MEDVKDVAEKLSKSIEAIATKANKVEGIEADTKAMKEELATLTKMANDMKVDADKNQKALDELVISGKAKNQVNAVEGFGSALEKGLNDQIKKQESFKGEKKGFALELKVPGNLASATSLTGSYLVPPTVVPGVFVKPYELSHIRDFVPVGQTNSNIVRYIQDNGPTNVGTPGMTAEGGTKPQIDRSLQIIDAPVRKIATYFRVPEEMIDDIPYISSFLSQVGVQEVMIIEDNGLLYGDGTGQNLSGLFTNATAFSRTAAGVTVAQGAGTVNSFDVIGAAKAQIRLQHFVAPCVAFVNPGDYYQLRFLIKDTTQNYMTLGGGNGFDLNHSVDGTRVVEHPNVSAGDFLVCDPTRAQIFDRMGTTVRFYDQDQDNAIKNLITIVIEKRLTLAIYYPKAFVKGTFATAKTNLTT